MNAIEQVFEHNRSWAARMRASDLEFFDRHVRGQQPEVLWIGCSDSRVPASVVTGLGIGEAFVHRNVGNVVEPEDANGGAVIECALEELEVRHLVVCGHSQCGAVRAALAGSARGRLGAWLAPLRTLFAAERGRLEALAPGPARERAAAELNVRRQLANLVALAPVHRAVNAGRLRSARGWLYELETGLLHELEVLAFERHTGARDG